MVRYLQDKEKVELKNLCLAIKDSTAEEFPAKLTNLEDFINRLLKERLVE